MTPAAKVYHIRRAPPNSTASVRPKLLKSVAIFVVLFQGLCRMFTEQAVFESAIYAGSGVVLVREIRSFV